MFVVLVYRAQSLSGKAIKLRAEERRTSAYAPRRNGQVVQPGKGRLSSWAAVWQAQNDEGRGLITRAPTLLFSYAGLIMCEIGKVAREAKTCGGGPVEGPGAAEDPGAAGD